MTVPELVIDNGDLVDFGAYGQLYVISWGRVTDEEAERFNPYASGWNINMACAKQVIEKGVAK